MFNIKKKRASINGGDVKMFQLHTVLYQYSTTTYLRKWYKNVTLVRESHIQCIGHLNVCANIGEYSKEEKRREIHREYKQTDSRYSL